MVKLFRMDLYRMMKARSFLVCLILTFALGLAGAPLGKLMFSLAGMFSSEVKDGFPSEANLSGLLTSPFPLMGLLLMLLSLCYFFYADTENGYIKNIAGQMPMKGFTILSKFLAAGVHNLIFTAAGIIGNLIGTLIVQRLVFDGGIPDSFRVLALKLLLLQSICAILLLAVSTFRSKSLGMVLAVLFGLGLTPLIYGMISEGLSSLFGRNINIGRYMPDVVMKENPLDTVKALLVAFVAGGVFLTLAMRIFDRKDVK